MKTTLLVLAAGMGSRYGGLKQIDPVGPKGEAIIDYSIYDAIEAGFEKVVFVIRRDIEEAFKSFMNHKFDGKIEIDYAYQALDDLPKGYTVPEERQKPWGTGQAVLVAKDKIEEPFLMINGDDFYGKEAFQVAHEDLKNAKDGEKDHLCMVAFELDKTLSDFGTVSRGVCDVTHDGLLKGIEERVKIAREGDKIIDSSDEGKDLELKRDLMTSMNMFGFTPSIFQHLESRFKSFLDERGTELKSEFFVPTVVNELMQENLAEVQVLKTTSTWFGITYPDDKASVVNSIQALIREGVYPESLY